MAAPDRHDLVGVDATVGLFAEKLLDFLLNERHPRLAADQHHFVDLVAGDPRVLEGRLAGPQRGLHQVVGELLELGAGESEAEVFGPAGVGGEVRQGDIGGLRAGQFDLGALRRLLEPLQRHAVLGEVDALLLLELGDEMVDHPLIEVIAAQVRIAVGGTHLEGALAELEDRYVEGAAAEVVHGDVVIVFLVETVGERGGGRLVDDAQHLQPRDFARVLGRVALAIVEVGGDGDDRLGDRLAQVRFGVLLQLLQDHRGDLRRPVLLVAHLDPRVAVGGFRHLVRQQLDILLDVGVLIAPTHETLHAEDGVVRVRDALSLGDRPHQPLSVLADGHHRRSRPCSLLTGHDDGLTAFHHRHDGVRRPQVDADHLSHRSLRSDQPSLMRSRLASQLGSSRRFQQGHAPAARRAR